jgi:archaemetzincin
MSSYRIFFVLIFILATACTDTAVKKVAAQKPVTLFVQPFKDIDTNDVVYVVSALKNIYPFIQVKEPVPLPLIAWNASRGRYRADSLIRILSNETKESEVTIGLTGMDISTTKDNKADWGIMGLGFCPGRACIASTFRLSTHNRSLQLFKVAIHELGHTQGLQHCKTKTCLMRDAEGSNHLNEEKDFCTNCRALLIRRGWQFDKAVMNNL